MFWLVAGKKNTEDGNSDGAKKVLLDIQVIPVFRKYYSLREIRNQSWGMEDTVSISRGVNWTLHLIPFPMSEIRDRKLLLACQLDDRIYPRWTAQNRRGQESLVTNYTKEWIQKKGDLVRELSPPQDIISDSSSRFCFIRNLKFMESIKLWSKKVSLV